MFHVLKGQFTQKWKVWDQLWFPSYKTLFLFETIQKKKQDICNEAWEISVPLLKFHSTIGVV